MKIQKIRPIVLPKKEQEARLQRWKDFWNAERQQFLKQQLIERGNEVGFKEEIYAPFYQSKIGRAHV